MPVSTMKLRLRRKTDEVDAFRIEVVPLDDEARLAAVAVDKAQARGHQNVRAFTGGIEQIRLVDEFNANTVWADRDAMVLVARLRQ